MEDQLIPIKFHVKPYEVLALCFHMYNKGYYIQNVKEYGSSWEFLFKDIQNIIHTENPSFSSSYLPNDIFEFSFVNNRDGKSNNATTSIQFNYKACRMRFQYKYVSNYDSPDYRKTLSLISVTDNKKEHMMNVEDDKNLLHSNQNKTVKSLKFYEEFAPYIIDNFQTLTKYFTPAIFTLNFIYNFRTYADNIMAYQKKSIMDPKPIIELFDCFGEDMQINTPYQFKILRFYKNNNNTVTIGINRKHTVYVAGFDHYKQQIENGRMDYLESEFKIIIPIVEQLGGVSELKNVILEHRIRTE